jgi:hypothetical protein
MTAEASVQNRGSDYKSLSSPLSQDVGHRGLVGFDAVVRVSQHVYTSVAANVVSTFIDQFEGSATYSII